jgi:hypothetical protein
MQRRAAIAAYFLRCGFDAQPVTARGTFGIQALNGPTGQVLHPDSPRENENEPTTTSRKFGVLGTPSRAALTGRRRRKRETEKEQLPRKTRWIVRRSF